MKYKLICNKCESPDIEMFGPPSPLDGKLGYLCNSCSNEMGPRRSKVFIAILMLVAIFVTLTGMWGLLGLFVVERNFGLSVVPVAAMIAGLVLGPMTFVALFKAFVARAPRRVPDKRAMEMDEEFPSPDS